MSEQTDTIEAVARSIATMLEGGREYDRMPATRRELRIWNRAGMCSINDATQEDAREAAEQAIAAHTKALVDGAGELCERLAKQMCNRRGEDLCGCSLCAALTESAATIAALRAENERLQALLGEGVERGNAMMESSNAVIANLDAQLATARIEGVRAGIEASAGALEADAKLCDCYARDEGECACGAWSDYKTVPMERAVDVVRTLDPAAIIRAQALSDLAAADAVLLDMPEGEPQ